VSDNKGPGSLWDRVTTDLTPEEVIKSEIETRKIGLVEWLAKATFGLFAFTILSTLGLYYLQGFGKITLPEPVLNKLGYLTIGQVVAVILLIVRLLLKSGESPRRSRKGKNKP